MEGLINPVWGPKESLTDELSERILIIEWILIFCKQSPNP